MKDTISKYEVKELISEDLIKNELEKMKDEKENFSLKIITEKVAVLTDSVLGSFGIISGSFLGKNKEEYSKVLRETIRKIIEQSIKTELRTKYNL